MFYSPSKSPQAMYKHIKFINKKHFYSVKALINEIQLGT